MKKYYIIAAAIILVLVLGFYGCLALIKNATEEEVARVKSPSGKIEAVLIEENYGATVSFYYDIAIVPTGKNPTRENYVALFYGATRSKSAWGVNLKWTANDNLRIEYLDAKTVDLTKNIVDVAGQQTHIELIGGIEDQNAPAGGMGYNLHKK